jgi:hypothetical protein
MLKFEYVILGTRTVKVSLTDFVSMVKINANA